MNNISRTIMLSTLLLLPFAVAAAEIDRDDKQRKAVAATEQNGKDITAYQKMVGARIWECLRGRLHADLMPLLFSYYEHGAYARLRDQQTIISQTIALHPSNPQLACGFLHEKENTLRGIHFYDLSTATREDALTMPAIEDPRTIHFIKEGIAYDTYSSGSTIWNGAAKKAIRCLAHSFTVGYLPTANLLLAARGMQVGLWDLTTGEQHARFNGGIGSTSKQHYAVNPDETTIALQDDEGFLCFWEKPWERSKPRQIVRRLVGLLQFNHDGRFLAMAVGQPIELLDRTDNAITELHHNEPYHWAETRSLAWNKNGLLAAAIGDKIIMWDVATRQVVVRLADTVNQSIHFSEDSRFLVTHTCSFKAAVKIWRQTKGPAQEGFDAAHTAEHVKE